MVISDVRLAFESRVIREYSGQEQAQLLAAAGVLQDTDMAFILEETEKLQWLVRQIQAGIRRAELPWGKRWLNRLGISCVS